MKRFLAILMLLVCSASACAEGYGSGGSNVDVNGYVAGTDGYWYRNGIPYTRSTQPYVYCGRTYNRYNYQAVNITNVVNPSQPGWRDRLASFAGKIKLEAVEHAAFVESVEKLGLNNLMPMSAAGYGANGYTPTSGAYGGYTQLSSAGATQYAQDTTRTTSYGGLNPSEVMQLVQMSIRLNGDQQQLAHEGGTQVRAMVSDLGQQVTAVEEIRAKANAVATVMQSIRPEQRSTVVRSITSAGVGVPATQPGQPAQPGQPGQSQLTQQGQQLARLQTIFNATCVSCHKPGTQRKDLTDVTKLTADDMDLIVSKVDTSDVNVRMPKSIDGGTALPLADEDRRFIVCLAQMYR